MSLPAEFNKAYNLKGYEEDHPNPEVTVYGPEKTFNFKNLVALFIGNDIISEIIAYQNEIEDEMEAAKKAEEKAKEESTESSKMNKSKVTPGRIFIFIISIFSLYLCFKCNTRPTIIELLISVMFPVLYIMVKLGTQFDKCFPMIVAPKREIVKVL